MKLISTNEEEYTKTYQIGKYIIHEYISGNKYWYLNGKCHREDGAAIEFMDGEKRWCKNGDYHREDGPAIIRADGKEYWFLNGREYFVKTLDEFIIAQIIE